MSAQFAANILNHQDPNHILHTHYGKHTANIKFVALRLQEIKGTNPLSEVRSVLLISHSNIHLLFVGNSQHACPP